jgi:multiple sugar transport system substrate-binding protein
MKPTTRSLKSICATAAAAATLLAAMCFAGGTAVASGTTSHQHVTLTWWTWTANPGHVISNFEKAYPWITIQPPPSYGAGTPFIEKLEAALGTGTGPDITQLPQPDLPHFILSNDLLNIAKNNSSYQKDFPPAVWDEMMQGSALYAMPEDIGPAGFAYRPAILSKYDLPVPTTWSMYAADAVKLHADNPNLYLGYFPVNDGSYIEALFSQSKAVMYKKLPNGSYELNYDGAAQQQVINFWGKLIAEHAILAVNDYTPLWSHEVAEGTFATYMAPAWAPTYEINPYLSSKVPQTFQITEMPQWSPGSNIAANWGGSTNAITKDTPANLVADAALFAAYINTSKSGLQIDELPNTTAGGGRGLFPASVDRGTVPAFSTHYPNFVGNINVKFGDYAAQMSTSFQWSPWDAEFLSDLTTQLGSAAAGKESWSAALAATEQQLVSYVKDAGYSVES